MKHSKHPSSQGSESVLKDKDAEGGLSVIQDFEHDPLRQATETLRAAIPTC